MAIWWAVASLIISLASAAYSIQQAKKQRDLARKAAEARKGFEIPVEAQAIHLPVVYGRAKIGGARTFHATASSFSYTPTTADKTFLTGLSPEDRAATFEFQQPIKTDGIKGMLSHNATLDNTKLDRARSGKKNAFLFFQQALCQAPINAVYDVIVDQTRFLDDPTLGTDLYKDRSNEIEAALRIDCFYNGSQADPIMGRNFGERSRASFYDMSYISCVTKLDRENPQFAGVPELQLLIEGKKIRKVTAGVLNEAYEYSNNPAYVLLDYLLNPIFGKGLSTTQVDLASFEAVALICDTIVQTGVYVGGNIWNTKDGSRNVYTRDISLYECNIILDTNKPIRENIEAILATMGDARLIWSQGRYKLSLQYPATNDDISVALHLTDDDLVLGRDVEIRWPSASDRLNHCTVRFSNEASNFSEDTASWPPKLDPSVTMTDETYVGLGGFRYGLGTSAKGWDDIKAGGKLLNNLAVWSGNDFVTFFNYIIIFEKEKAGSCTIEATADNIFEYSLTKWNTLTEVWDPVLLGISGNNRNTAYTQTLTLGDPLEDTVYRLQATAEDTSDETDKDSGSKTKSRGFALRILKGTEILWTVREPAYQSFYKRTVSNNVYRDYYAEDDYMELETEIFAEGITDYQHALAKAEELVRTSRGAFSLKVSYKLKDKILEPGDFIRLTSDTLKLGNINPLYFRVNSTKLNEDFTCELTLSRFDSSFLAWNVKDDEIIKPPQVYDVFVPAPNWLTYTPAPINMIHVSAGTLEWASVSYGDLAGFILYIHTNLDEFNVDTGYPIFREIGRAIGDVTQFSLPAIAAYSAFFGIRTVSKSGKLSDMTLANVTFSDASDVIVTGQELFNPFEQSDLIPDPFFQLATDDRFWKWSYPDLVGDPPLGTGISIVDTGGITGGRMIIEGISTAQDYIIRSYRVPYKPAVTGDTFVIALRIRKTTPLVGTPYLFATPSMHYENYPTGGTFSPEASKTILLNAETMNGWVEGDWYEYRGLMTVPNNDAGALAPFVSFFVYAGNFTGTVEIDAYTANYSLGNTADYTVPGSEPVGSITYPSVPTGRVLLDDGTWGEVGGVDTSTLPHTYGLAVDSGTFPVDQAWDQEIVTGKTAVEMLIRPDELTNVVLDSRNKFTLTQVGAVPVQNFEPNVRVNYLNFPGDSWRTNYYKINRGENTLVYNNPVTMEAKIRLIDNNFKYALFGIDQASGWSSTAYGQFIVFIDTDGKLKFTATKFMDGTEMVTVNGPQVPLNRWSHVAVEWADDGRILLRVNGSTTAFGYNNFLITPDYRIYEYYDIDMAFSPIQPWNGAPAVWNHTFWGDSPVRSRDGTVIIYKYYRNLNEEGSLREYTIEIRYGPNHSLYKLLSDVPVGTITGISDDGTVFIMSDQSFDGSGFGGYPSQGRVYVYNGVDWATQTILVTPPLSGAEWGHASAISGDGSTISVANDTGDIRIFSGAGWSSFVDRLRPSFPDTSLSACWTMALSYDGAVLAANRTGIISGSSRGSVFIYYGSDHSDYIYIPGEVGMNEFGWNLALSSDGTTLAVSPYSGSVTKTLIIRKGPLWGTEYSSNEFSSYSGFNFDQFNNLYCRVITYWLPGYVNYYCRLSGATYDTKVQYPIKFLPDIEVTSDGTSVYTDLKLSSPSSQDVRVVTQSYPLFDEPLLGPDMANCNFGYRIAMSGDGSTLVVNRNNTKIEIRTGANFQNIIKTIDFYEDINSWVSCIDISDDGSVIVVGLPQSSYHAPSAGKIVVLSGLEWGTETILETPAVAGTYFGSTVAVSGNGLVIVASDNYNHDRVRVFKDTGWLVFNDLVDPFPLEYSGFGQSIAINYTGDSIAVGAPYKAHASGYDVGIVHLFNGLTNAFRRHIQPPPDLVGMLDDNAFGYEVALSDDGLVCAISARWPDDGYLYVFYGADFSLIKQIPNVKIAWPDAEAENFALSGDGKSIATTLGTYLDPGAMWKSYLYYDKDFEAVAEIDHADLSEGPSYYDPSEAYFGYDLKITTDGNKIAIPFNNHELLSTGDKAGSVAIVEGAAAGSAVITITDAPTSNYYQKKYTTNGQNWLDKPLGLSGYDWSLGSASYNWPSVTGFATLKDFKGYIEEFRVSLFSRYEYAFGLDVTDKYEAIADDVAFISNKESSLVLSKDNVFREVLDKDNLHFKGYHTYNLEPGKPIYDILQLRLKDPYYQDKSLTNVLLSSKTGVFKDYGIPSLTDEVALKEPWESDDKFTDALTFYSRYGYSGLRVPPVAYYHGQKVWGHVSGFPLESGHSSDYMATRNIQMNSGLGAGTAWTMEGDFFLYEFTHDANANYVIFGTDSRYTTWNCSLIKNGNTLTFFFKASVTGDTVQREVSFTGFDRYEQWTHIAISRTDAGLVTIYVNGVAGGSVATPGGFTLTGRTLYLGGGYRSVSYTHGMRGYIGSFRQSRDLNDAKYLTSFTPPANAFMTPDIITYDFLSRDNIRKDDTRDIIAKLDFTGIPGRSDANKWNDVGGINLRNNATIDFFDNKEFIGGYDTNTRIGQLRSSDSAPVEFVGSYGPTNINSVVQRFTFLNDLGEEIPSVELRLDGVYTNPTKAVPPVWQKLLAQIGGDALEKEIIETVHATDTISSVHDVPTELVATADYISFELNRNVVETVTSADSTAVADLPLALEDGSTLLMEDGTSRLLSEDVWLT
jgi:hypothetical protein